MLSLQQLFAATGSCMRQARERTYTVSTISAICKCNFFSIKAVILTSFSYFVPQASSKTSEKLVTSFILQQIFFWIIVKEAVILILETRKRIFSLLNTMFSCCYRSFPKLIGCHKQLLAKTCMKSCLVYCGVKS